VLDLVSSLTDNSLLRLQESPGNHPRYLMLETLREFGIEQLAAHDEEQAARSAHVAYVLEFAERMEPVLSRPSAQSEYLQLEPERGNWRAALTWLDSTGQAETLMRLASALGLYWEMVGPWSEGDFWLERALALSTQPTPARVQCLFWLASNAAFQGDHRKAETLHRAALEQAQQLEIPTARSTSYVTSATILLHLGTHYVDEAKYSEGVESLSRSLAEARKAGERETEALALIHLGIATWGQGRAAEAASLLEAGQEIGIEAGYPLPVVIAARYLAHIALAAGELGVAAERFRECWNYDPTGIHALVRLVPDLTALAVAIGVPERAAELFGAAEVLARETGLAAAWPEHGLHEQALAQTHAALNKQALDAAFSNGKAMAREQLLELIESILSAAEQLSAATPEHEASPLLTQREREVLALIVDGLSNVEIGDRLFISHRTAQTHVTNILGKLGASTRTGAAARAVRDGLV
jgi:non-specific serine/threonine protein kinase